MIQQTLYSVTPSSELTADQFDAVMRDRVLPSVEVFRRNVRGTSHQLVKLNGAGEYVWAFELDLVSGTSEPPTPEVLTDRLKPHGRVTLFSGPRVTINIELLSNRGGQINGGRFKADPNPAELLPGGRIAWLLNGLPPGYEPEIDFILFRAEGSEAVGDLKPCGELTTGGAPPNPRAGSIAAQVLSGPEGEYWYKVSLVPREGEGKRTIRLECHPEHYYDGKEGAGLKIPGARSG